MPIGRRTGDSAIAASAARSPKRRRRGAALAEVLDRNMPPVAVADPTARIEDHREFLSGEPREALRRAFCVFDPWALRMRLMNLDGPCPGLSARESAGWRRRCEEAIAREDALQAVRADLPIALRAKLEKRYAFEAAEVCAGFLDLQDDAAELDQSVGRAGHKDKGAGGAAMRRRAFFGPVVRALRDHDPEFWSWSALADLILQSETDWRRPPCPRTVAWWANDVEVGQRSSNLADVLRKDPCRTQGAG